MIDGSPDDTEEILKNYSHTLQNLRIINQENQGRAKVRNNGAQLATGDLLIFFDDDMRPSPTCIAEHINANKNAIVVGAQIDDYDKATTDIQQYRCFLSRKWAEPLINLNHQAIPKKQLHLTAANFSIPTTLFNKLEGFDERLNDAEDYDLAVRAFEKKISIHYYHEAFAFHDDFITCKSYIHRQKEYRSFHKKLLQLKPDLYKKFDERQAPLPAGAKAFIFQLFSLN